MRVQWRPRRYEIFIVLAIITGLWLILFARIRPIQRGALCQSNLRKVGLAAMIYIRDYDEHFPLVNRWTDNLRPYARLSFAGGGFTFQCPSAEQYGYAMNSHLDGAVIEDMQVPAAVPWFFESSSLRNAQHDKGSSWPSEPRHPQGVGAFFGDGRFAWYEQPPPFRPLISLAPKSRP